MKEIHTKILDVAWLTSNQVYRLIFNYLINSNEEFHIDIYKIIDIITHGINEDLEL
jgi:hypothetical protein